MVRVDYEGISPVTVKVAETPAELEGAARLLHDCYVGRGLITPHPTGVQVTPHLLLPSTATLVAKVGDTVVGTMSLHVDSPLGVPSDKTYPDVLQALRAQGRRVAEVGALCIAREHRQMGVVYLLNKMVYRTAALLGVDDMVIGVHPDAELLYRSVLRFERIGERRKYQGLTDKAEATFLRLRVKDAAREYLHHFGSRVSPTNPYHLYIVREDANLQLPESPDFLERLEGPRARAVAHLARLRPDIFVHLSPHERAHLSAVLPFVLPHPVAPSRPSRPLPSLAYALSA
ncbi:hypothetical protein P2318_01345 [Myxococcaceae bacterium GXIMD 01537]